MLVYSMETVAMTSSTASERDLNNENYSYKV